MWLQCQASRHPLSYVRTWTSSRLLNPLYSSKIRNWDKGVELRSHRSHRRWDTCLSRTFTSRRNSKKLASKSPDWLSCSISCRRRHLTHMTCVNTLSQTVRCSKVCLTVWDCNKCSRIFSNSANMTGWFGWMLAHWCVSAFNGRSSLWAGAVMMVKLQAKHAQPWLSSHSLKPRFLDLYKSLHFTTSSQGTRTTPDHSLIHVRALRTLYCIMPL